MPNILGPIAVYATLTIPQAMLLEGFKFFKLGIQPPMSSLGTRSKMVLNQRRNTVGHQFIQANIHNTFVLYEFFGDGLRDALDPKTF